MAVPIPAMNFEMPSRGLNFSLIVSAKSEKLEVSIPSSFPNAFAMADTPADTPVAQAEITVLRTSNAVVKNPLLSRNSSIDTSQSPIRAVKPRRPSTAGPKAPTSLPKTLIMVVTTFLPILSIAKSPLNVRLRLSLCSSVSLN